MLEEALHAHELVVIDTIKKAKTYTSALTKWKKACDNGSIVDLVKASEQACTLATELKQLTRETQQSWDFDVDSYLKGDAWLSDIKETASDKFSLRTLIVNGEIISSPVIVRALPNKYSVMIANKAWYKLRPSLIAAELKRLRDKTENSKSSEFLESLFMSWTLLSRELPEVKFRDIYELFCIAPGYKKEHPPISFGQEIYALQKSKLRATKAGRRFIIETPSGNFKEKDIFTITSEDGKTIRYYNITFLPA